MSATSSQLSKLLGLALFLSKAIASPLPGPEPSFDEAHLHKRADLNILKTTITPSGQIIDWISAESQSHFIPLPAVPLDATPFIGAGAVSELLLPGVDLGPPGSVPIPRMSKAYMASHASKQAPPGLLLQKRDVEEAAGLVERDIEERDLEKRGYEGTHWYVNSNQAQDPNYGSQASYSMFKAATQSPADFSLLQTAVVRTDAQKPYNPTQTVLQTLEAGWINYPNQISQPHVFTFYTVDGYATQGPYSGGWNTDYPGWVQTSKTYYPGVVLTPLSTIGGAQNEVNLKWFQAYGVWLLQISGPNIPAEYMGYYPAALFSNHTVSSGPKTLANSSNMVAFYGEIYQTETAITTTDMGSGNPGYTANGYKQAGYMHNMTYLDIGGTPYPYTASFGASNVSLWNYGLATPGASNWGKYIYLGGPGAGGKVGS